MEVLQQQEELIEDEQEQEQREEDARRAKKEEEARLAESLLPDSEVRQSETPREIETLSDLQLHPERVELEDARMTTEQLKELAEALSVVSAQSSVLKERDELRALMEENLAADEVGIIDRYTNHPVSAQHGNQDPKSPSGALTKRIRSMLTKIDAQLKAYDSRVGNSLQMISVDSQGRISVEDLEKALAVIKHKPDEEVGHLVIEKLDADKDGFVELDHLLGLVKEEGLGQCCLISDCLELILA